MTNDESGDGKKKAEGNKFGCCNPENLDKMFEMMKACCQGRDDLANCSAMMKNMMGMCSGSKATNTNTQ